MHLDRWNCVVFSKGKFGETVVKSFPEQHAVNGFSEFSQTSYISNCDKTSHGGRPKYIVTVSSTVSVDPNGFAFETPRAICTYAEFMTNPLRAPEIITPGFVLNRLVRGVMYMLNPRCARGHQAGQHLHLQKQRGFRRLWPCQTFLEGARSRPPNPVWDRGLSASLASGQNPPTNW